MVLPAGEIQVRTAIEENIDGLGYRTIQVGKIMVEGDYHILALHVCLLFVSQLDKRGLYITFGDNRVIFRTSPMGKYIALRQQIGKSHGLLDETDHSDV